MKRFEFALARKPGDYWYIFNCTDGRQIEPYLCPNSLEMLRDMGLAGWSLGAVIFIPGGEDLIGSQFFYFQRELCG